MKSDPARGGVSERGVVGFFGYSHFFKKKKKKKKPTTLFLGSKCMVLCHGGPNLCFKSFCLGPKKELESLFRETGAGPL